MPFSPPLSRAEIIRQAYAKGELFVHMLEDSIHLTTDPDWEAYEEEHAKPLGTIQRIFAARAADRRSWQSTQSALGFEPYRMPAHQRAFIGAARQGRLLFVAE